MSPSFKITVASILFLGIPLVGWSFYSFGPAFGFVLLPVTIASYLGHRMHLARFDQKTQEISEIGRAHV